MSVGFVPGLVAAAASFESSIAFWDIASQESSPSGAAHFFNGGQGPDYSENTWELVTINGMRLPGKCSAKGLPTLKIDHKKKGGADSITFTATGYLPGPIDVSTVIWTASQWEIFRKLAPKIWRTPTKAKAFELAMPIFHPGLALWKQNQVIVQGVSTPEPGPFPQSMVIHIRCLEYIPPDKVDRTQKAKSTPKNPPNSPKFPGSPLNEPHRPSDSPPGPKG